MPEQIERNARGGGEEVATAPSLRVASKRLALAALLLLPALTYWTWVHLVHPRPYWVHFYDPETIYFYQGLRLLEGRAPTNIDNPGTPVQAASALLALAATRSPLELDAFRTAAYLTTAAVALLSLLYALPRGRGAWPFPLALFAAWSFWITPGTLEYSSVWSPEAFTFPLTVALLVAVARWNCGERGAALLVGSAVGLAAAVKLTFLSWAFAAGLCMLLFPNEGARRVRDLVQFSLGLLGSFVFATLPALARYPELFAHLGNLLAGAHPHSGQPAASGGAALITGSGRALAAIAFSATGWTLLLAGAAALAFLAWRSSSREIGRDHANRTLARALLAAGALLGGQAAMLSRGMETHYLVPLGVVLPLLAGALALARPTAPIRAAGAALALASVILVSRQVHFEIGVHERRVAGESAARKSIAETVASLWNGSSPPVVVHGFRSPDPAAALRYHSDDPRRLQQIEAAFPSTGHVDWFGRAVLPAHATCWNFLVESSVASSGADRAGARRVASTAGFDIFERVAEQIPGEGSEASRAGAGPPTCWAQD